VPITFDTVTEIARAFPDIERVTKYDGSPVLKVHGSFVAGLATDESVRRRAGALAGHAEADTLVVRVDLDDRVWLLEDAPETYYVTDYYRKYPVVLARMSALTRNAVHDLLAVSRTLALAKVPHARRHSRPAPR
jgi:hypothetical protein